VLTQRFSLILIVCSYGESLIHNPKFVLVSMEDIDSFDRELTEKIRKAPADFLPLAEFISKLVKISGIVTAASRTKAKATYVTLLCKNCKNVKSVPWCPGLGGAIVPRSCDHVPQPGEEPCPIDPWVIIPDKSKYVDQHTLKLQENPEDEGSIFYSDQAQFPRGDPDQGALTCHSALRKFKEFIRSYNGEKGDFPYRESLIHNPKFVLVSMEDIDSFDGELTEKIRKAPADFLPLFETAASEVLSALKSKVPGETGEMEEPTSGEVQIFLCSNENVISMRSLGAEFISKLVKISGIVIAASRTKAKATYVTFLCKNCKNVKSVPCRPGLGGAIVPRSCDHVPQPGEEPCPIDPWVIILDKSKYVDQHTLKLQENPE
ncbi:hypothetical protein KI387_001356, partial [Taxus chinensis]